MSQCPCLNSKDLKTNLILACDNKHIECINKIKNLIPNHAYLLLTVLIETDRTDDFKWLCTMGYDRHVARNVFNKIMSRDNVELLRYIFSIRDPINPHLYRCALKNNAYRCFIFLIENNFQWCYYDGILHEERELFDEMRFDEVIDRMRFIAH